MNKECYSRDLNSKTLSTLVSKLKNILINTICLFTT